jgi:hypothetical protein
MTQKEPVHSQIKDKMRELDARSTKLKPGQYLFGGRGDVWSGTAHIAGEGSCTLCGKPMLSSNWVAIEGVTEVGCPKCIEINNR